MRPYSTSKLGKPSVISIKPIASVRRLFFEMDELVDILDTHGKPTGKTAMKSEAHKRGWFHPTVHIWFYTADGRVLVQQRGSQKDTHPLLWDVSVAGHIGAGEEIAISALREVEEEIGLRMAQEDLEKIGVFKSVHAHHEALIDCEFHHVFLCELQVPLTALKKQESEVEDLKLVSLLEFHKETQGPDYVPHGATYFTTVVQAIQKRL